MKRTRLVAITLAAVLGMSLGQAASGVPGDRDGFQDPVTGSLLSTCDFPVAGAAQVTTGLTATFPVAVPGGVAVAAKEVTARVVLPEPTVAALRSAGVHSVEGIAYLDLAITYLGETTTAQARLGILAQPLPEAGAQLRTGTAELDSVPTSGPGDLTLAMAAPRLALLLRTEDGGLLTDESLAVVPCTPEPDQDPALATVHVTVPEAGTKPPLPPVSTGPATGPDEPVAGPGERSAPPGAAAEEDNPCGEGIPDDAVKSLNGYYEIVVTTTVTKLDAEVTFGPPAWLGGQVWIWRRPRPGGGNPLFCNGVEGLLALPPTESSFTIFRFVPASSVINVIPVGKAEGVIDPITFEFTGRAVNTLRLSDVRVGGTPLSVGPNCRTEPPIVIDLHAKPTEWNLANGGVIEADFTIPPFAGCGVAEPLDSLFTNLVSGPGNHIKIDFGPIKQCSQAPTPPPVCEPSGASR